MQSMKTFGVVTATGVIQIAKAESGDWQLTVEEAERLLDERSVLRRTAPARLVQKSGEAAHLEIDVTYGPVRGAYRSDVSRQLQSALHGTASPSALAVVNYKRREVTQADVESLRQQADTVISVKQREYLDRLLSRLTAE